MTFLAKLMSERLAVNSADLFFLSERGQAITDENFAALPTAAETISLCLYHSEIAPPNFDPGDCLPPAMPPSPKVRPKSIIEDGTTATQTLPEQIHNLERVLQDTEADVILLFRKHMHTDLSVPIRGPLVIV